MKRILWLSHLVPYPPKGGVLQRSYNLIREISKHHEVTLLAFNQRALCRTAEQLAEAKEALGEFCEVSDIIDIDTDKTTFAKTWLIAKGVLPWRTYTLAWLESGAFKNALSRLVENHSFDLVHADTISLAPYALSLPVRRKVLNHHNIESMMMIRRARKEKKPLMKMYFHQEGKKLKSYESKTCHRFDLNIACSQLDVERLRAISPKSKSTDIPNGVDLSYFMPESDQSKIPSLIFAGGLSWYPNLDAMRFFLTEVWPTLCAEFPEIDMTIVGRNPPSWMISMQTQYPNLEVTGFVEDVRPYLERSFIYICPIRDGGGTKLKVLDALAMGKLLIADPVACEGIDVQPGKHLLLARTQTDYVKAIKSIIDNPVWARETAKKGQAVVREKYSFDVIGKRMTQEYEKL